MMDISGLQGKDSDACIRVLALPRCITRGSIVCKEMQRVCTNLDEVSSKRAESAKAAASPMHPNASDSIQRARTTFQIHKTNNVKRHKAPGGFKVWVFFKYIYIYIYVKSNQLHGPTMSRSSDKKYAPAWMTCGRLSFSASAKATMAGAISPWHSVASSQRLQRTRRWQKINDEMLMIEMIEMVIWLLWNIFLKSPKHAPLDWVQNGCCSNVPKGFKERLPHWRRRLLSSPYGGSKKVLEMFKSLWVWEVQIFTLIQTYLWRT